MQTLLLNDTQLFAFTPDELIDFVRARVAEDRDVVIRSINKSVTQIIPLSEEWLTTEEAKAFLNIKSDAGFRTYRKKNYKVIKQQRTGKGNQYLKSSLHKK